MTRSFLKSKKGFTLIELLVVIAIIGVLASIVLASLNTARRKGRDTRRVADMGQVRLALELYYDAFRYYPTGATWASLTGVLNPTYIGQVPNDPIPSATYLYQSTDNVSPTPGACAVAASCQGYVLSAQLEEDTNQALGTDYDTTVGAALCPDNNGVSPDLNRRYCVRN